MLCSYDDLCYIMCTVLRGRYCVIHHLCCSTNKTIIISSMGTCSQVAGHIHNLAISGNKHFSVSLRFSVVSVSTST